MTDAIEQFETELFQEHIEEASFLYEQRTVLMYDESITWTELASSELRRKAHLDALEQSGVRALQLALAQALASTEPGDLYVAASTCCLQNRPDAISELVAQLPSDEQAHRAVADALIAFAPDSWLPQLLTLADKHPAFAPPTLIFLGARQIKDPYAFMERQQENPMATLSLCQTYARLNETRAEPWLTQLIGQSKDEELLVWGAISLAALQHSNALKHLRHRSLEAWTWLPLALAGDEADNTRLLASMSAQANPAEEGLLALGLFGFGANVPFLLECLSQKGIIASTLQALNIILGADLFEEVFVPEEIDVDELNEQEAADLQQGQRPLEPSGKEAGNWTLRLAHDPEVWKKWWTKNGSRFAQGRFRQGEAFTPAALVDGMQALGTSNHLRQWNALELTIRHGCPWLLDLYAPVSTQKQQLQTYATNLEALASKRSYV